MPNWCNNFIMISGEESNMKPIYDLFNNPSDPKVENWVMSTLVPEDEEFEKIKESGDFLINPYTKFWGCKWDVELEECKNQLAELNPLDVSFSINTAWSPPEPFCQRLSEKYGVTVDIEFSEPGSDFAGRATYIDGVEEESVTYSYREGIYILDIDCFWHDVQSDLEWMFCENPSITIDEVLGQLYPFITNAEDIKSLTEIYNEQKVDEPTEE